MQAFYDWEQPTSPEEERFDVPRRRIWYMLRSYVVKRADMENAFEWSGRQNFWGRWMPESHYLDRIFLGFSLGSRVFTTIGPITGSRRDLRLQRLASRCPFHRNRYTHEGNGYDCSVDDVFISTCPGTAG